MPRLSHTVSIALCTASTWSLVHPRRSAPLRCHRISRGVDWGIRHESVTSERSRRSYENGSGEGGKVELVESENGVRNVPYVMCSEKNPECEPRFEHIPVKTPLGRKWSLTHVVQAAATERVKDVVNVALVDGAQACPSRLAAVVER